LNQKAGTRPRLYRGVRSTNIAVSKGSGAKGTKRKWGFLKGLFREDWGRVISKASTENGGNIFEEVKPKKVRPQNIKNRKGADMLHVKSSSDLGGERNLVSSCMGGSNGQENRGEK